MCLLSLFIYLSVSTEAEEGSQDSRFYYPEDSTYESIQVRASRVSKDRTHSCRNQNKDWKEYKKK